MGMSFNVLTVEDIEGPGDISTGTIGVVLKVRYIPIFNYSLV
jgi:hypothetical protein